MYSRILKRIIFNLISSLLFPLRFIVKKDDVIIFQSRSFQSYCDNTKFLYEHFSENTNISAYWVTNNVEIKKYINSRGWKYISWHNPLKMLWVSLKTKIVVDNGDSFFNFFGISNSKSVVKITCSHGSGPKVTISRDISVKSSIQQIENMNKFDYVNFTSDYCSDLIGKKMYFQ